MSAKTEGKVREILALLPEASFARRYCAHMEKRTEAHLGYQLAAALSLLTQTAPSQLAISRGADLFANELFLLVGASGRARKSTVVAGARRILSDGDYGVAGMDSKAVAHSDIASVEGMQDFVYEQPRSMLAMEEFGDFLQKTSSPVHAAKRTMFNNLFDCTPMGRIRVQGKQKARTEKAKNPRITAIAGCAPRYLMEYTRPLDWTGGFMSRWFMVYGTDERKLEPPTPNRSEIQMLVKLLDVKNRSRVTPSLFSGGNTPMADEVWQTWTGKIRSVIDGLANEHARAALQRAETHALKVALLLAWDLGEAYLDNWRLTARALVPAIKFVNLHIRSMARMIAEIPASEDDAERVSVLAHIEMTPKQTTRKKLLQDTRLNAKKLAGHIDTLYKAGYISIAGSDGDIGGSDTFCYSAFPQALAKADHYDALPLWDPPAEAVTNERGGETALASLQIETAARAVEADAAGAPDEEV